MHDVLSALRYVEVLGYDLEKIAMQIRNATIADFEALHRVRMSVRENQLSHPGRITFNDYALMLEQRGAGWLCEEEGKEVGFAIADVVGTSIWALFVLPEWEGRGIGKKLHDTMVRWCFDFIAMECLSLTTDPGTRAETFYTKAGWVCTGLTDAGEVFFVLDKERWLKKETP